MKVLLVGGPVDGRTLNMSYLFLHSEVYIPVISSVEFTCTSAADVTSSTPVPFKRERYLRTTVTWDCGEQRTFYRHETIHNPLACLISGYTPQEDDDS